MEAVFQAGLPIGSMSVSALTKYALGDPDEEIRKKAMQIAEKSIEPAVDLGVRTVMIPGYDNLLWRIHNRNKENTFWKM